MHLRRYGRGQWHPGEKPQEQRIIQSGIQIFWSPALAIIRFIVKGLQRVSFEIYLEVLQYVDKSSACESRE
jgi:hypothetical protein